MNAEEILIMSAEPTTTPTTTVDYGKKERLYSLAASGKTKQYLGVNLTIEEVQQLSEEEIKKYHARYESYLGAKMVRSLGRTIIGLYTKLMNRVFEIDSERDLIYDLDRDPVLTKTLETFGCDLYFRFGSYIAPLVAGLITFNHINFNHIGNGDTGDRGDDSTERSSDEPTTDSHCYENETPRQS